MYKFWRDPSLYLLVVANLWPLWLLMQGEVLVASVYWSYLGQSAVMAVAWTARLIAAGYGKDGTGEALGMEISVTTFSGEMKDERDYSAASIFLVVWLGLTVFYALFLVGLIGPPQWNELVWLTSGLAGAQLVSLIQFSGSTLDPERMNLRFAQRMFPMHLAIIIGFLFPGTGPVLFLFLMKTVADAGGHIWDHGLN